MQSPELHLAASAIFEELVGGVAEGGGAFTLNSGDVGLLRSLDTLSAADASRSLDGGATVAAHVQHLRYGLGLMSRWAEQGGNPFADAHWDEAWRVSVVNSAQWSEIRDGFRREASRWQVHLSTSRPLSLVELQGLLASVVHLAYHLGAIRQIARAARGPREGTFVGSPV
ncbi:MAG: hypothetical protein ACKVS7_13235 [Gemmatimonadaceae bacterium]